MDLEFEWDEAKRRKNLAKHGIDFMRAKEIWQGDVLEFASLQGHHGEERFLAVGMNNGYFITVVYTRRHNMLRIISARIARNNERKNYQSEIGPGAR